MKWRCHHRSPKKSTSFHVSFLSRVNMNSLLVCSQLVCSQLVCSQHMALHSSVGRTLQRSRRFHGFESCWSLFEACWSDYNRNDHISISFVFPHFKSTSFHLLKYTSTFSVSFSKVCVWMSVALRFVVLRCVALRNVTFRCVPVRSVHSYGTDRLSYKGRNSWTRNIPQHQGKAQK